MAELTLELWAIGSDGPVTTLLPDTAYEVHYSTDADCVNDYALFAVATSADQGFEAAEPPSSGAWSETANLSFLDLESELGAPAFAPGFGADYYRYRLVSDQLACSEDEDAWACAGSEGYLCNITTSGDGELHLQLYMAYVDESGDVAEEATAQAAYVVQAATDE